MSNALLTKIRLTRKDGPRSSKSIKASIASSRPLFGTSGTPVIIYHGSRLLLSPSLDIRKIIVRVFSIVYCFKFLTPIRMMSISYSASKS